MATREQRLRLDIEEIRRTQDRTGKKSERNFRWEGMPDNPNGWRKMGDLADDLEALLDGTPEPEPLEAEQK